MQKLRKPSMSKELSSVDVDGALVASTDGASGLSESDFGYYGWRVVLAASLGVMAGAGMGAMVLPVVAQSIISHSGWRTAYACLGGLALLLGLPLSFRYVRERGAVGSKTATFAHSGMTWQEGLRSYTFWIVTAI